ncbi:hypothetical protein HUU51_05645 [Candidatus Gracilibacteria bacterium]|nr:hypothetical protein [Candidatus Gracilibacteria bacterium]
MKKIILSFLLILTVSFLSGCSSYKDELFEKKQECNKYYDDIIKYGDGGYINKLSLKEIFYSNKLKSCLFVVKDDNLYSIYDFLEKKEIFSVTGPIIKCGGTDKFFTEEYEKCSNELETELNNKIKELKGE